MPLFSVQFSLPSQTYAASQWLLHDLQSCIFVYWKHVYICPSFQLETDYVFSPKLDLFSTFLSLLMLLVLTLALLLLEFRTLFYFPSSLSNHLVLFELSLKSKLASSLLLPSLPSTYTIITSHSRPTCFTFQQTTRHFLISTVFFALCPWICYCCLMWPAVIFLHIFVSSLDLCHILL